jgi:hypothetical protein
MSWERRLSGGSVRSCNLADRMPLSPSTQKGIDWREPQEGYTVDCSLTGAEMFAQVHVKLNLVKLHGALIPGFCGSLALRKSLTEIILLVPVHHLQLQAELFAFLKHI